MTNPMATKPKPKPIPGSREDFLNLWGSRRAAIQAQHDPVACRSRGMHGLAEVVQQTQNMAMKIMDQDMEWVWAGELGKLWQWAQRVDLGLLREQLEGLETIQAEHCIPNSYNWQILEGVMNMLGELRDLLEKGKGGDKDGR